MASQSLNDLRPEMRSLADAFLDACTAAEIDVLVTCTLRSEAEQALLYSQGRTAPGRIVTNAKPGFSAHNYGLALDIVPMVNGKPDWNGEDAVWGLVGAIGQQAGLQWLGAPGSPFLEKPHFQHPNWRTLAQLSQE